MGMKKAMPAFVRKCGSKSALGDLSGALVQCAGNDDFLDTLWPEASKSENASRQGFIARRDRKPLFDEPIDPNCLGPRRIQSSRPQLARANFLNLAQLKVGALYERTAPAADVSHG